MWGRSGSGNCWPASAAQPLRSKPCPRWPGAAVAGHRDSPDRRRSNRSCNGCMSWARSCCSSARQPIPRCWPRSTIPRLSSAIADGGTCWTSGSWPWSARAMPLRPHVGWPVGWRAIWATKALPWFLGWHAGSTRRRITARWRRARSAWSPVESTCTIRPKIAICRKRLPIRACCWPNSRPAPSHARAIFRFATASSPDWRWARWWWRPRRVPAR